MWLVGPIQPDPISDRPTATAFLIADSGSSKWGNSISLFIRCDGGRTVLYVNWNEFVNNKAQPVEYRIGARSAQSANWQISTNYQATFYPASEEGVVAFIQSMFGEIQFIARTTPYGENTRTATFNITGVEHAVANVRKACGW